MESSRLDKVALQHLVDALKAARSRTTNIDRSEPPPASFNAASFLNALAASSAPPLQVPDLDAATAAELLTALDVVAIARRPHPMSHHEGVAEMASRLLQRPAIIESTLTKALAEPRDAAT